MKRSRRFFVPGRRRSPTATKTTRLRTTFCGVWAVVACISMAPAVLRADEDAGLRSVFGFGAGNRALALGGAYTGIADDASAPLWNPGGLGWAQRRMFDASYTQLYGLGIDESYAALVVPSRTFGTLGLTFRQFSVGGIELRDDRNFVLSDDESNDQMQLTLAYGRAVANSAWSFGGALQLQRHRLAGFSDMGLGLDLGLGIRPAIALGQRSQWAQRLSLGVAMQNAVAPTLRLDQTSVPDPATARVGVAYWLPVARRYSVLFATDVEKTNSVSPRVHVGVETMFRGTLALRVGYNADMLTAGSGVRVGDISFDYVYEGNPISDVHRFGASWRFGMSVDEMRVAARAAEDAALETRLAEEFRKRQEQQISALLREAESARQSGRLDHALEFLGSIKVLDPESAAARDFEARCWREKAQQLEAAGSYTPAALAWGQLLVLQPGDGIAVAGQTRCRDLSDRRAARSQEIRRAYAAAVEAFGSEDFVKAKSGFARVLEMTPGDREAADLLQRTNEAIARRATNLVQLAGRLAREGLVREPLEMIEQARKLDPRTPGLAELEARLRAPRPASPSIPVAADQTGTVEDAAAPVIPPTRQKEIDDLYRRGLAAMKEGRPQEALRFWELVWELEPGNARVREHLKREYMTQGLESFAQGDLAEAIRRWEKALRIDPSDARAVAYLARAQEQQARTREILGKGQRGSQ